MPDTAIEDRKCPVAGKRLRTWDAEKNAEPRSVLILRIHRRLQQTRRNIDNGHNPVIRHPGRTNHPKHADVIIVQPIRRRHNTAIIQNLVTGFMADEVAIKYPQHVAEFCGFMVIDYPALLDELEDWSCRH